MCIIMSVSLPSADPGGGGAGGPDPLKNHKNIGFLSNIDVGYPEKTKSHQAIIQCWATIGKPA